MFIIVEKSTRQVLAFSATATKRDARLQAVQMAKTRNPGGVARGVWAKIAAKASRKPDPVAAAGLVVVQVDAPPPFDGARWDFTAGGYDMGRRSFWLVNGAGELAGKFRAYPDALPPARPGVQIIDTPPPSSGSFRPVWDRRAQAWVEPARVAVVDDATGEVVNVTVGHPDRAAAHQWPGCTMEVVDPGRPDAQSIVRGAVRGAGGAFTPPAGRKSQGVGVAAGGAQRRAE